MHAHMQVQARRDDGWEGRRQLVGVNFFHHVGPGPQIQASRLSGKHLYFSESFHQPLNIYILCMCVCLRATWTPYVQVPMVARGSTTVSGTEVTVDVNPLV